MDESVETPALAKGTPNCCYGALFERLDKRIQMELGSQIMLAKQPCDPIAPNFFLELKGPSGYEELAQRQALYYGALGDRGQIALRSCGRDKLVLDDLAHTISCTLRNGFLSFFSIHAARSRTLERQVDYFINAIDAFILHMDYRRFKKAVSAYQSCRNMLKE